MSANGVDLIRVAIERYVDADPVPGTVGGMLGAVISGKQVVRWSYKVSVRERVDDRMLGEVGRLGAEHAAAVADRVHQELKACDQAKIDPRTVRWERLLRGWAEVARRDEGTSPLG